MGMFLILMGISFVYIGTTMWYFIYLESERKLKKIDYVIGMIPIVRTIYMMFEIEVEE